MLPTFFVSEGLESGEHSFCHQRRYQLIYIKNRLRLDILHLKSEKKRFNATIHILI